MRTVRQERVRELLKRELGEIIRRELPLRDAGVITVNEVLVTNDLQVADVYIGVVGTAEQRKKAAALLHQERKRIQSLVGRAVVLKYTPQLRFTIDDSVVRGNRILEIIEEIERTIPPNEGTPKDR
jgi:ribosome-binding factor A